MSTNAPSSAIAALGGVMDNSRTLRLEARMNRVGHVDYSLARKATLGAYRAGRVSRLDICDAHPDLLRAARFCGELAHEACPVCDADSLVLVSYVFSDQLPKRENGRVWTSEDLTPLFELAEVRLYRVEVCPGCSWNHVRSQLLLGEGRPKAQRRGHRAST